MPRTFAYVRVSTSGQTTENQVREIEAAGFAIEKRRVVSELAGKYGTSRQTIMRVRDAAMEA
jgi:putative DNA-invertase from lambdoid prophage Rac